MGKPLVSIVIPAYKPDFFKSCLDSALAQTYENLEIVVSDDCPSDAIKDIVSILKDSRVRYIQNRPAHGSMFNYVESFKYAKGELIKFLNDDDVLHPECVQQMVPLFEKESVKIVTSYHQLIDEHNNLLPDMAHNKPLFDETVCIKGHSLAEVMLMHRLNLVGEPTCFMFRKQDVSHVKPHLMCFEGYGYEKSGLGDIGLILNLIQYGDCVYLGSQPLSQVRLSDLQWQNQGGVRQWSTKSWKIFRKKAIAQGMFSLLGIGWNVEYYKTQNDSAHIYKKNFMTIPLFVHQLARLLLPSR